LVRTIGPPVPGGLRGQLLSISLEFPNVLYCMNNEIGEPPEWGRYWARYIRAKAAQAGKKVYLTDMRRNHNFSST
jgi:hypothetical protein